jgi:hypothetical protein
MVSSLQAFKPTFCTHFSAVFKFSGLLLQNGVRYLKRIEEGGVSAYWAHILLTTYSLLPGKDSLLCTIRIFPGI